MKQKWVNILAILVLVFILIPIFLNVFNVKITENMDTQYSYDTNNDGILDSSITPNNFDISNNNVFNNLTFNFKCDSSGNCPPNYKCDASGNCKMLSTFKK